MFESRCLCGRHVWQATAELELMHHCHCGFCRKAHGTAFTTDAGVPEGAFSFTSGGTDLPAYSTSPGFERRFCGTCGTPLPHPSMDGRVFLPVACSDDDPGVRPLAHIFVGSKAPWFEIEDGLPTFDTWPPGFDGRECPSRTPRDPEGAGIRGSCLCGQVHYVVTGEPIVARHCHCSRCRRARGAPHASNLVVPADGIRFTGGRDALREYRVPEARFFTHTFCGVCGSSMPRIDLERGIAIVPMGGLDDDPGVRPREHIFTADRAPWYEIPGGLPQYEQGPPG